MDGGGGGREEPIVNWTDAVDDLVDSGDVDGAISLLESVVSRLETLDRPSSQDCLRLASALGDLADLHSSRGCSIKADELRARSLVLRARACHHHDRPYPPTPSEGTAPSRDSEVKTMDKAPDKENNTGVPVSLEDGDEDDWEAIADALSEVGISKSPIEGTVECVATKWHGFHRDSEEMNRDVPPEKEKTGVLDSRDDGYVGDREAIVDRAAPPDVGISRAPNELPVQFVTPKRRGRGSFMYSKSGLYSDDPNTSEAFESYGGDSGRRITKEDDWNFGTRHIRLLYDLPACTQTVDLEKLFEKFGESSVAIRWVDDTSALAVFRTPDAAHEAQNSIRFPFKVREIDEYDSLLNKFSRKELEPPCPRPKTSARTAQRLIAQGMGLKLSTGFGSGELRKQEEARKDRIRTRQNMRDDAWGSEDP